MKVLITGIAGFIGYHTAIKFNQLGHDVAGFDNFNNVVYDNNIKHARVKELRKHNIFILDVDLVKDMGGMLDELIHNEMPDLVIHLAAHAGVRVSLDNPIEYIQNNIIGTQNLITVCEEAGIQNVIYASTSCVMEGNDLPWGPDEKLNMQLSPYGYSKQTNENQFNISAIKNAVGLRFFTVYGPWGRPDMALYTFAEKIINNQPIDVYNNGDMKRDFTYIDDIVQGIEIVSRNMTKRDIYCIGYGKQVQLMDFISHIENSLDRTAIKVYKPKHPADALETWSDISKLEKLGYKPTVPVSTGVSNFIDWFKNYVGNV